MSTVTATVARSGSWWAVKVLCVGTFQYTQGRTLAEALGMARDVVSIMAEEDPSLTDATVELELIGPVQDTVTCARQAQRDAEEARVRTRSEQARTVSALLAQGLTVQDVATLMGITREGCLRSPRQREGRHRSILGNRSSVAPRTATAGDGLSERLLCIRQDTAASPTPFPPFQTGRAVTPASRT